MVSEHEMHFELILITSLPLLLTNTIVSNLIQCPNTVLCNLQCCLNIKCILNFNAHYPHYSKIISHSASYSTLLQSGMGLE